MRKLKCKECNSTGFKIYPNKLCQRCLSLKLEESLRNRNKKILIDSESLINDYLIHFKSMRQIAREHELTPFQIKRMLVSYSIPVRDQRHANAKYINKDVFKELNPDSAYLLGYIFTDGDLLLNMDTGKYFLRIYSKHKYMIENVKEILSSEAKIQFRNKQKYKDINQSEIYFIHIGNQEIIDDLMDYGLVLKKNKEVKFPKIPENLISHFLRGVWSGSGNISINQNNIRSSLNIGSYKFIFEIEKYLNNAGLKKRTIYTLNHSKTPSYCIKYSKKDSFKLYEYIYNQASSLTICKHQEQKFKTFYFNKNALLF